VLCAFRMPLQFSSRAASIQHMDMDNACCMLWFPAFSNYGTAAVWQALLWGQPPLLFAQLCPTLGTRSQCILYDSSSHCCGGTDTNTSIVWPLPHSARAYNSAADACFLVTEFLRVLNVTGKGALAALEDAAGARRFHGQHVALCGYNEPVSKWLSDFEAATGDTPRLSHLKTTLRALSVPASLLPCAW
jgi:hypothetical protein